MPPGNAGTRSVGAGVAGSVGASEGAGVRGTAVGDTLGAVLGEDTLMSAAESAEGDGEMWLAACRWAAAALVAASGFGTPLGKVLAEASAARTIETTGPGLLTRVYFRRAWDCACLPKTILYPVANDGTGGATAASITVHRWECSWKEK